MIKIKNSGRYAMVVPTSIGLRLSPASSSPVHTGGLYTLQATSAETNVASISSYLGLPVKVLTAFVEGNPMSQLIKENLRSRGMDYEGPSLPQGGPWGYRHQINIADSGYGLRGPRVWNDRAGEVGRAMRLEDFDIERIFSEEGVKLMHLSGLIASLSPETGKFCLALAQAARRYGTAISFDLNYRASFWEGREQELREIFSSIASEADILIGNEEDFQLCLGIEGPEAGGKDLAAKTDAFIEMMGRVRKAYPRAKVLATTLREVVDANRHLWGAIVLEEDRQQIISPREIRVLDRIGGGDGFVGGLLYGILKGWECEKYSQFAWASGVLAVSDTTDYAHPTDEEQIWSIWKGNARVKR